MIPPDILKSLSQEAARYANWDTRLPEALFDNNVFNSSEMDDRLAIDYNQVDVAMAFIGHQQKKRTQKKKMDERSLVDVYELLDQIAFDAVESVVNMSLDGSNVIGVPDLLPLILEELRS